MKACSRHAGNRCFNRELYELNAMITKGFFAFSGYLSMPYHSQKPREVHAVLCGCNYAASKRSTYIRHSTESIQPLIPDISREANHKDSDDIPPQVSVLLSG